MKTTLTLDDDVAAKLKDLATRANIPFKEALNTVLRRGFGAQETSRSSKHRFSARVFESPFRAGVDPLHLNQLADDLEVDAATVRLKRR